MRLVDVLENKLTTSSKVAVVTDALPKTITKNFIEKLYGVFNENTCAKFSEDYKDKLVFFITKDFSSENLIKVFEKLINESVTSIIVDDAPKHLLRSKDLCLYTQSQSSKINVSFI